MSKFYNYIPEPWKWYWKVTEKGEADCGIFNEDRPGMAYSVARCPRYQTKEQWEKDAKLICTAPKMLRMLQRALDEGSYDNVEFWNEIKELIKEAEEIE